MLAIAPQLLLAFGAFGLANAHWRCAFVDQMPVCKCPTLLSVAASSLAFTPPTDIQQILSIGLLTDHMLVKELLVECLRHFSFSAVKLRKSMPQKSGRKLP